MACIYCSEFNIFASPSTLLAGDAFVFGTGIAARFAVVLAVAIVALVGIGGKPIAGVGPLVADWRGLATADRHRAAGEVFLAVLRDACPYRLARSGRAGNRNLSGGAVRMAKLLRLDGIGVGPESAAVLPRIHFRRGVGGGGVETLVVPRHAVAQHLLVDVDGAEIHDAEDASVLVLRLPPDKNVLAVDVLGQLLFRLLPERLRLLRSVDSVKADLVLGVAGAEDRQRIAVGDLNHPSAQLRARRRVRRATRRVGSRRMRYAASRGGGVKSLCTDASQRMPAAIPPTIARARESAVLAWGFIA